MKERKIRNPFKCMCITIGNLPSAYLESMTYYEALTFIIKFLKNEVIPTVNNNSDVVKELQEYVTHYFDNLDVQEEINNKLDDMAENGELVEIISQYLELSSLITYDTISDLKSSQNLINGSIVKTLGYYTIGDNGGAIYKVREIEESESPNDENLIALYNNELIAELVNKNDYNVKVFGVKGDGETDDTDKLQDIITFCKNKTLYLNNETYLITTQLDFDDNKIIGNNSIILADDNFTDNYMIDLLNNNTIKNIKFDLNRNVIDGTNPSATDTYLNLENCEFTQTKKYVDGNNFALNAALNITAKESYITKCKIYNNNSHGAKLISSQAHSKAYISESEFNYNGNYDETITAVGLVNYEESIGANYDEVVIDKCIAHHNANSGIAPHTVNNCLITNCYSYNNLEHGYVIMTGSNATINNCIAKNNTAYGIRVQTNYDNFIISNNIIEGTGGLYISENVNNGLITNNKFIGHSSNASFGIVLSNSSLAATDTITNLTITNNMFNGTNLPQTNWLYAYFALDETNIIRNNIVNGKIIDKYYIIGNSYNTYITPLFKYSNNYDNLNTDYGNMSTWTAIGTLTDNTFTVSGGGVCRKSFDVDENPKYINVIFDKENYNARISLTIRFRDNHGDLITFTNPSGTTSNNISTYTYLKGKITSKIIDLNNYVFTSDVSQVELFVQTEGTADMTINNVYISLSNDNTVINSI